MQLQFSCILLAIRNAVIPFGLQSRPGWALTSTKCIIYLIRAQQLHLNFIIEPVRIRVIYVHFFHSCLCHYHSHPPPTSTCGSANHYITLSSHSELYAFAFANLHICTCVFIPCNMFNLLQSTTITTL